jgi:hypothetical protein
MFGSEGRYLYKSTSGKRVNQELAIEPAWECRAEFNATFHPARSSQPLQTDVGMANV